MKIAVTGAFGYSGRFIAQELLRRNETVVTLTNRRETTDPFNGQVQAFPLDFNDQESLVRSMDGCDVLVNTYWVRFNYKTFNHKAAVDNSCVLFEAAKRAGVRRVVHTSIARPDENSPFEYYRGKAQVEKMLRESDFSWTILRPTVIFGPGDILINNIAWTLRRFPIVGYFGDGKYRLRPIHVEDFALLAANAVGESENRTIDAVGPEIYEYKELLETVGRAIGRRRPLIRVPVWLGYLVAKAVGWAHRDVFLTREEIGGLTADLLTTDAISSGSIRLSDWLRDFADSVGRRYAAELARRR